MSAHATWFGPTGRPLAGWLHLPDGGAARGAVVLCPPVGLEYVGSHRTVRVVAERLCSLGFVALRFDYDGTGDSAGDAEDPDRVASWLSSITAAVEEVRAVVGAAPVAVLGLRLGATLLMELLGGADRPTGVAAAVLWDPATSGRRYLRQQRALGRLVGGVEQPDGSVDAPGFRYSPETVRAVESLDVRAHPRIDVPRVLVLVRPDTDPDQVLREQPAADREVVEGMAELLDVQSIESVVPTAAVERCVGWLDAVLPGDVAPVVVRARRETEVAAGIVETHRLLGPLGLVAVETAPTDGATRRTVLLLNNGAEHHIGPVRMWPELARRWARHGIRTFRLDLSGLGDSPSRPGIGDDVMYSPHDEDDVLAAVEGLGLGAEPPVFLGLCFGGHLALRAAAAVPGAAAVAANVGTTRRQAATPVGPHLEFGSAWAFPRRVLRSLGLLAAGRIAFRRLRRALMDMPAAFWLLLGRLRLVRSPGSELARLRETDVTLICGPEDAVGYLTLGRHDLERARRMGVDFVAVDDLDHVPMAARQRDALKDLLTEQVLRRADAVR